MKRIAIFAAASAVLAIAAPAQALSVGGTAVTTPQKMNPIMGTLKAAASAVPKLTYVTNGGMTTGLTGGSYSGVGSLIITHESGAAYICTGSLVGMKAVVTAAHCLSDVDTDGTVDAVTGVKFYTPSYGERSVVNTFVGASWAVESSYVPEQFYAGGDVAMLSLVHNAIGHTVYSLYDGDPLAQYTQVGTGTIGGPGGTGSGVPINPITGRPIYDYKQRTGNNLYEYHGDEVFSDVGHNVLLSDFDDGTAAHDLFYQIGGNSQRGVTNEANSSPGDSGGPEFINGQIVSVTSWGSSVFGVCGPGQVDPYATAGCTNSSIGEMAGNTWLKPYSSFINDFINATYVPEPASWALMLGGFGFVGGAVRRRKAKVSVTFA